VAPRGSTGHALGELRRPLGIIGIDKQKLRRIAGAYRDYALSDLTIVNYQLTMDHADLAALVTMGPATYPLWSSASSNTATRGAGELAPAQLAAGARASGLDFIATTEHNTADTHGAWGRLAGDDLLVILGQEVTTQTGHWLALGIAPGQAVEWRYGIRPDMVGRYLNQVHQAGGLCVAAHPHAPYPGGVFMYPFDGFDAVEVWNGLRPALERGQWGGAGRMGARPGGRHPQRAVAARDG